MHGCIERTDNTIFPYCKHVLYENLYGTPVELDSLTHITISQLKHLPTLMYYGNYTTPLIHSHISL